MCAWINGDARPHGKGEVTESCHARTGVPRPEPLRQPPSRPGLPITGSERVRPVRLPAVPETTGNGGCGPERQQAVLHPAHDHLLAQYPRFVVAGDTGSAVGPWTRPSWPKVCACGHGRWVRAGGVVIEHRPSRSRVNATHAHGFLCNRSDRFAWIDRVTLTSGSGYFLGMAGMRPRHKQPPGQVSSISPCSTGCTLPPTCTSIPLPETLPRRRISDGRPSPCPCSMVKSNPAANPGRCSSR